MRILLLNPPGQQIYIRDYFCSKTTKSNYLFHPVDLITLSGTLSEIAEIEVLDCIAERLNPEAAHERIQSFDPEIVVSLVGSVAWEEDRSFLAQLHETGRRVIAIGDVLQENSTQRLNDEAWLEAILHVFANQDIVHYLAGRNDELLEMTIRTESGPERIKRGPSKGVFQVPRPRHELFPKHGYQFSFARSAPFATVLTDYGCPWPCTFCVIGTLGFQTRAVEDVLEEIDHLRAQGVRELFFMDQTFGVKKERAMELCAAFAERGDLSWTAFTRPDTASAEMCTAMRAGGCHTVIMGVESADDGVLALYKKGYKASEVGKGFERAREAGLRTVGTFIIGLPEETEESLRQTLEMAIGLELDFMSVNMAVPRFGTPFRAQVLEFGLAEENDLVMDQGGADAFLPTQTLNRETMLQLKKRMIRRFYLRPGYLLRRLRGLRNFHEFRSQVREGWALLMKNV